MKIGDKIRYVLPAVPRYRIPYRELPGVIVNITTKRVVIRLGNGSTRAVTPLSVIPEKDSHDEQA